MKNFIKNKFETLYFFYQYLGLKIFFLLLISFLMVLMDTFGLTMFVPLLQVSESENGSSKNNEELYSIISSIFSFIGLKVSILNVLILLLLLFSLKGVFTFYMHKYKGILMQTFSQKIRTELALGVRDLSYKNFITTDVGRLQSTLTGESWQVVYGFSVYIEVIKNALFILVYIGIAFTLDWKFSILIAIGGSLTNLIYNKFYTKTKNLSREILQQNHGYGKIVIESTNHYKYLKATGRNFTFFDRLQEQLNLIISNNIRVAILNAKITSFREPLMIMVIVVVIWIHLFVFKSSLSGILVILLLFYRAMQMIMDLQTNRNNYLANIGTIENVRSFKNYLLDNSEVVRGDIQIDKIKDISLCNVSLKYENITVLKDINIHIENNQSIAFVGESGSGKTSLVNIISALIIQSEGLVHVNGVNLSNLSISSYRDKIGYISQEPTIFNASIFDNVTFWAERTPDNLQKFQKVIEMCSLLPFVNNLEDGMNTLLGNNGINISGGQKQRISIARELFREVDVLIMDEATSALDSETEKEIKESIESLQGKLIIISIAHRLSTIYNADIIYVLDKGSIVAQGNFTSLQTSCEYFKKLTELQGM